MEYRSPGVYVEEVRSAVQAIAGVGTSTAGFIGVVPDTIEIPRPNPNYDPTQAISPQNVPDETTPFAVTVKVGEVKLCTNFSDFKRFFGDFSNDTGQNLLAHAVYGFFNNGGTSCYVVRVVGESDITVDFLEKTFEPIDDIAIVAAPGILNDAVRSAVVTHCAQTTQDRFAMRLWKQRVKQQARICRVSLT
jgi:uncharacterized protein